MRQRAVLIMMGLLVWTGCSSKPSAPQKETVNPLDRVNTSNFQPNNFLHKTFPVRTFTSFSVEVPPHIAVPRIHGTFTSFINQGGGRQSDESTNVSFLLMSEEQYGEYAKGNRQATALYTVESSHSQEVEYLLPPTKADPMKYYVTFVNLPTGKSSKVVEADFALTSGY